MIVYTQTDTAADSGTSAGCSGETLNANAASREIVEGGTAGSSELMFDVSSGSTEAVLMFQTDVATSAPDTETWEAGDYVVRMNVTTSQNNLTWVATYICERQSDGTFSTVASLTGQSTDITTAGVHTQTVNRATDYTPSGTDSTLYIVCVVQNTHSHTTRTVGVTPDQQIDTPIEVASTASGSVTVSGGGAVALAGEKTASGTVAESGGGQVAISGEKVASGSVQVSGGGSVSASGVGGYAAVVLGDNPTAYWRLGESSGTNAADETGGHDGTYSGTFTLGESGAIADDGDTAASFNDGLVTVPDADALDFTTAMSVECWFRLDGQSADSSQWPRVVSKGNSSNTNGAWSLFVKDASDPTDIGLRLLEGGSGGDIRNQSLASYDDGAWHHVVGTYDQSATAGRLYLDGQEVASNTSLNITIDVTADDLTIADANSERAWNGGLDEVAVYDTALTATQVSDHYEAGSSSTPSGSVTISGGGQVSATGSKSTADQASVSGGGQVTAVGEKRSADSLALSGGGTVAVSGSRSVSDSVTVSGGGTVQLAGAKAASDQLTILGGGVVSATGEKAASGSVQVQGGGQVSLGTAKSTSDEAAVSGGGRVTASGTASQVATGSVSVSGGGRVSASGEKAASGAVAITGGGKVTAAGQKTTSDALAVTGGGSVSADGSKSTSATVEIPGGGTVSVQGSREGSRQDSVTISGGGQVTASGTKSTSGAVEVPGGGTADVSAEKTVTDTLQISGGGATQVTGEKVAVQELTVSGGGQVQAAGQKIALVEIGVSGGGSFSGDTAKSVTSPVSVAGGGSVIISGQPAFAGGTGAHSSSKATAFAGSDSGSAAFPSNSKSSGIASSSKSASLTNKDTESTTWQTSTTS